MTVRRAQCGFTLVEMLVTLTVLGVLMGVAVPSFRSFVAGQKIKTASHDLMTAMVIARSEAIKRNADVTVAPNTAGAWQGGWTVKVAPSATTVHQQQEMTGVTITKKTGLTPSVVYKGNGRPAESTSFEVTGSTSAVKCVKVDLTGIPSTQPVACP